MQKKRIYVDEFGNAHADLSKKGAFSHFVYATVILDEANLEQALAVREHISQQYFQGQPLASGSLPNTEKGLKKRVAILEELLRLKFDVFALVVNKKELNSPGLQQKDVFYKFFSKLLVKQFPNVFASFTIYAPPVGHPAFQADLKSFLNTTATQRDLFEPDRIYTLVEDQQEEPLLQLAGFIAGCLGKMYCNSHADARSRELFNLLYKRLTVDFFPYEKTDFSLASSKEDHARDTIIKRLAEASAVEVLRNKSKSVTPETREVLNYLYMVYRSAPAKLISTYEIIERVQTFYPAFNKFMLRQSIQHLRDLRVLITSIQGKSGYKLPDRLDDIIGFYKRYMDSIVPMLNRIDLCNQKLVMNDIQLEDALTSGENFALLTELIDTVKKRRLAPQLELS